MVLSRASPPEQGRPAGPFRIVALAAGLTLALLALIGLLLISGAQRANRATSEYLRAEALSGEIVHRDEALTMSARMAAATGEVVWIDRYASHVAPLEDSLAEVLEIGEGGLFSLDGLLVTGEANDVLLAIEDQAFALIRQNDRSAAAELLNEPTYQQAKSSYTAGINQLSDDITTGISNAMDADRATSAVVTILSGFAVVAALSIWLMAWRSLRDWQRQSAATEEQRAKAAVTQRALRRSQRVLASLTDNTPIDWWTIDPDGYFTANGGQKLDGLDTEIPFDKNDRINMFDLVAGLPDLEDSIKTALGGSVVNRQVDFADQTSQSVFIPIFTDGAVTEVLGVSTDITFETELQRELQHQAEHDSLTGLLNRAGFERLVDKQLPRSHREAAMVMLDMSGMRELNDLRGHSVGDHALVVAARRIEALAGADSLCARIGGDEFCVFVPSTDLLAAEELGASLIDAISGPIAVADGEVSLTGFASVDGPPLSGSTFRSVLPALDIALTEARRQGRNSVTRFSQSMVADFAERVSLTREIEQAIAQRQFHVVYQPIWDAASGRIAGAEALARWTHPTRGPIPPSEFIPRASSAGLVREIDTLIVDQACSELGAWRRRHPEMNDMRLSMNLSADDLTDKDLTERIRGLCAVHRLEPADLLFELTETAAIDNLGVAQRSLRELRELGCRVALDDFGTGYSSLSQLQNLDIDVLKVDRSFVSGEDSATQRELCEMIVSLAKVLNLRVVAEGVETQTQLGAMRQLGCDYVQGYLLARPLAADDFLTLTLAMHRHSHEAFETTATGTLGSN